VVQFAVQNAIETAMWRLAANGDVVKSDDETRYECPDDGRYRLRCTGYSDVFQMDGEFGIKDKIKVEFEVVGGEWNGTRFAPMYNVPAGWGPKSILAQVVTALQGPIQRGQVLDFDDLLGKECMAMVVGSLSAASGVTYAKIMKAEPVSAEAEGGTRRRRNVVAEDNEPPF